MSAQGIKIGLKQPEQPVLVLVEPMQLEQVLVNILTNGLQAMQHSSEPGFSVVLEVKAEQAQYPNCVIMAQALDPSSSGADF